MKSHQWTKWHKKEHREIAHLTDNVSKLFTLSQQNKTEKNSFWFDTGKGIKKVPK
jgi:hypothetical protein